ncbi:DUF397 domain-containing protein [Plantactinospora solaniradicis]|uniref:DUF397 domain-containing protein n=1 Tax=Plantactinospora solaniradicis TaxID=1723736 RepID=A0ABW1KIF6_9ACTN
MLQPQWRKSSKSANGANCVEARRAGYNAQVRDSKDVAGPVLSFRPAAWTSFVEGVKEAAGTGFVR